MVFLLLGWGDRGWNNFGHGVLSYFCGVVSMLEILDGVYLFGRFDFWVGKLAKGLYDFR